MKRVREVLVIERQKLSLWLLHSVWVGACFLLSNVAWRV
jgi:hypothetical protein